jgi:hypothetical protein
VSLPAGERGHETLVEQRRQLGAHESGVGHVGIAHGVGEPRRLERQMETLGAERRDLVSRFRSSHHCAAASFANFGNEGHWQLIDLVWLWFRSPHFAVSGRLGF